MLCQILLFLISYLDRCYYQGDCGRFCSHILADVIAIYFVCEMVVTHTICYGLILNTLADVIASLFYVVDGKTTIYTSIYWLILLPW